MKTGISRRVVFAGAATSVFGGSFVGYKIFEARSDPADAFSKFIARLVPDLGVDEPSVEEFCKEAVAYFGKRFSENFGTHVMLMSNPWMSSALDERRKRTQLFFERLVITAFFRSTDYFDAMQENRPVSYLSYADPYAAGCSNPLAA